MVTTRQLFLLITSVQLTILGGGLSSAGEEMIELIRDHWGTPHVFATTDAGAFYGLGYATAE